MPQKLTVLDLFSGIGGFSLGLECTGGFRTIAFCEIDPYCQRVLNKHWPDVPIHSDIRSLTAGQFEQRPDLLCGGFPCQDISVAGKGVGLTGERSGLWFEMLRVIRELRPTWLLIENVPNLRTKGADIVFAGLEEAGYTWTSAVVGAWAVGAPHKRDRVWILAHSKHNDAESRPGHSQLLGESNKEKLQSEPSRPSEGRYVWPSFRGCAQHDSEARRMSERPVGKSNDGVSRVMVRNKQLNLLGNSVVPQIPELFGRFILQIEGTG